MIEKYKSREIRRKIANILMAYWDPIGVNDVPEASDEYDNYIYGVLKLMIENGSDEAYRAYFISIETNGMGLKASTEDKLNLIIEKIKEIKI